MPYYNYNLLIIPPLEFRDVMSHESIISPGTQNTNEDTNNEECVIFDVTVTYHVRRRSGRKESTL